MSRHPHSLRCAAAVAGVLLVSAAAPSLADPGKDNGKEKGKAKKHEAVAEDFCSGGGAARPLSLTVEGQRATGLYAVPKGKARGLVVYTHGYGHTAESWRKHLTNTAARNNVIAVAMNYRGEIISPPAKGETRPSSRGWQVAEGAADSNAAAQLIERRCAGLKTIVLFGVSMGGNTAGLALAAKPTRSGGAPLYDYWFQMEGVSNIAEFYQAARGVKASGNAYASNAVEDIERQMGGTFEAKSDVYLSRSVVNRIGDIAASGIKGVVVMHSVADGSVPYSQSRELQLRLHEVGIANEFYSFAMKGSGESGTTIDSYVTKSVPGFSSPFAGHASEASETHIQSVAGFDRLSVLLKEGRAPKCGEHVIDGATGNTTAVEADNC